MQTKKQEDGFMPLYEGTENVLNEISVKPEVRESVVQGTDTVVAAIADAFSVTEHANIALDGWYGVEFEKIAGWIGKELEKRGIEAQLLPAAHYALPADKMAEYKKTFVTDDPSFGWVNDSGTISDVMDPGKVSELKKELASRKQATLVYGYGSAVEELYSEYDKVFYFDKTQQPMLWQMWGGELVPFGETQPKKDYNWKEYYYCDYYLLIRQKFNLFGKADYYVQAVSADDLKLMPMESYREIASTLVKYPIKEVEIYQPGPWGGYRFKDLWDVKGLSCSGWNELAGVELGVMADIGDGIVINMPFSNMTYYGKELVGETIDKEYPGLFPLSVWCDDGYFEKPVSQERSSMPIHNHPSTDYVKKHFNEPLGRYETYYIMEAYEGANTLMGFKDDADLEAWERKCRESDNKTFFEDWKDYVCRWESRVGDLYLIPPGTDHGHGGNQMVLEMDTCPSVAGTEYSFFSYGYAAKTWDDNAKSMTGSPMKMQPDHVFPNSRWRRESYVKDHLCAQRSVVKWTKDYYKERYSSLPEMPFEIERILYYDRAENDTEGKFAQVLTLAAGKSAIIRSKKNPELCTRLNRYQAAVIPASFGEYEILSEESGGENTIALIRLKKG